MHRLLLLVSMLAVTVTLGCGRGRPRGEPQPPTPEIDVSAEPAAEAAPITLDVHSWPWWRGPARSGIAADDPRVAVTWDESTGIAWETPIPGRGHASPTIIGDQIVLLTADEDAETQSVLSFNRLDGTLLWTTEVHSGNFEKAMHRENSQASSTVATDGTSLFALFLNNHKIWLTTLDMEGNILRQTEIGNFQSQFGYSTSPMIFGNDVIVAADHLGGGFLAAVNRADGLIHWRKPRPARSTYATPQIGEIGGRNQILLPGAEILAAYDPADGEEIWRVAVTAEAAVGTPVLLDDIVLASAGYPNKETLAVKADGSSEVLWRNDVKVYVPSMIRVGDAVYAVTDDGIGYCWDARTGNEHWKKRIGGKFRGSPVSVNGRIYMTDMSGSTLVFEADPAGFKELARNPLGSESFSTPSISDGRIYLRTADDRNGPRRETLYCIAPVQ